MKTVLVPTEPHDVMRSVLDTALLVGQRFEAYLEGFALRPAIPDYVPIDMVSGLAWHVDEKADEEAIEGSRALFEAFMRDHAVDRHGGEPSGVRYGWHPGAPAGDAFLASHGRVFDLVVLGRPLSGKAVPSMATLEAVLFETGRPLLIAPPTSPTKLGEVVVIAWNGSTETARTVAFSTPFLRRAREVIVVAVEGWSELGPSADQLVEQLRRNGVSARSHTAAASNRNNGETILQQAAAFGADLLVKGAYTQSRLRQMIFGGATAHILANATLPVIMAN